MIAQDVPEPSAQWNFNNADDLMAPEPQGETLQATYNLLGQHVKNPRHGIYIINGKKVLVK